MSKELTIKLDTNLSMFTAVPHPGFQYLGRIERGMEVGALALTPQGDYVQVNGCVVTPLNTSKVLSTLRKLQARYGGFVVPKVEPAPAMTIEEFMPSAPPVPVHVPVTVKRKKRILVMPE
ncbi:MAG: hypothetical protein H7332_09875 [Bdellovibrionales bacterium]|nr:hypothetical protein [Ramlibacter sp.]